MSEYDGWLHDGLPSPYDGLLHPFGPLDIGDLIVITRSGTGLSVAAAEGIVTVLANLSGQATAYAGSSGDASATRTEEGPSTATAHAAGELHLVVTGRGSATAWVAANGTTPDTTPPVLTWGPVTDPVASETMTVEYALDDGAVVNAYITFNGGTLTLPMTIAPGLLSIELPSNVPDGEAVVYAVVADAAGNEATYELHVIIVGQVTAIQPGYPAVAQKPLPPERVQWASDAEVASSWRMRVTLRSKSLGRVTTTELVLRRNPRSTSSVVVRTIWATSARRATASAAASSTSEEISRIVEGPVAEEELFLLLL